MKKKDILGKWLDLDKINPNDVYEAHSKKYPKLKYEYSPAAIQSIMIELMNEKVFDK